jgi:hypothetical protein
MIYLQRILVCLILLTVSKSMDLQGKSISETTPFPDFCHLAATNEKVFNNFKREPVFTNILEHVGYELGLEYLNYIKKEYPEILLQSDYFRENDLLGNPVIYDYGQSGWFSPTTLRYMKVAGDLKKRFGDLSQMHIVEIGGGYGGQCKILAELCGFASYTLIDLPQVNELSKKYLDILGLEKVKHIDCSDLNSVGVYDLVISNYAFSEIDREGQQKYLEKVILPTKKGYMTINFISKLFGLESLTLIELMSLFRNRGEKMERENPISNSKNIMFTWSVE